MTQARTQHTLTVVGDKIGELPLLKGQCHPSFQLEDFCREPVSPEVKNLVTMSLYPPLGLFSSGKKRENCALYSSENFSFVWKSEYIF